MTRWRYRPLQAAAVAALAALMTACAAFAPLYYRAMQQALTEITLEQASVLSSSVQLSQSPEEGFYSVPVQQPEVIAEKLPHTFRDDFHAPVLGYTANTAVLPGERTDPVGDMFWRGDACDHLDFSQGRCPTASGEIAVSAADVKNFGLEVGTRVQVGGAQQEDGNRPVVRLKVVGVYKQTGDDYWFGQSLTGRSGIVAAPPSTVMQHDTWITARDTFDDGVQLVDTRSSSAGYLIDDDAVGVDELLDLGAGIDKLAHQTPDVGMAPLSVATGISDLADDVQEQIDQSRVTVPLLMAQLCLLAVVVLWLVLLAVTEQRRPEVALARLRGRGRRGARGLLLAELLPITLLAVVPGAVLAVLAAWFARAALLPGDAPLEVGLPFVAALVLAAAVLAGVTAVAVRRVASEPVERLLRRVPPRTTGWALGAADAIVIAGAGGIVVVFATGGLDGPIALAAPGLLAIVVGLVLAHLTMPTAALFGRRQLRRGRVRVGVSMLDAARSPATRRIVATVTLAAALAVFSADAIVVGERNRATAAEQEAGAPVVATIRDNNLVAVREALDEVDPDGTRVTPVVRVVPPGKTATSTVGVVPASFRSIALFPGGAPDAALWDRLAAPESEPIELTGSSFRVDLEDSTLSSARLDGEPNPVTVGLDLVTRSGETLHTTIGQLGRDTHSAHFEHPVSCTDTCKVTGIWFSSLPGATINGKVTLTNLVTQPSGDVVGLGPADEWTPYDDPDNGGVIPSSSSPDRLSVKVKGLGASILTMKQNWLPTQVPALVSGPLPPGSIRNRFTMAGLDAEVQDAAKVGTLDRVPASPRNTFVANLDTLQRGRAVYPTDHLEVWFADDDPALLASVTSALAERGVTVANTTSLADIRRAYDESSAAWSLQLAALVGAVALLIALLVLIVSAVSSWRFRTRDLAALRMSGVPTRSIRSMAVAAQLPAVVIGVVAGTISGLVGAQLAMPIVPLFADDPEVSTLDLSTAWRAVGGAALGALVLLAVVGSLLIGRALSARADLRRLRETL